MDKAASILIIDDEPQIRVAVRDALREVADRIGEAATGAEGLHAAASERPELVVLDLGLPDTAGVDVCRELRRLLASPIIVLSARHRKMKKFYSSTPVPTTTSPSRSACSSSRPAHAPSCAAREARRRRPRRSLSTALTIDPVTRRVDRDGRQIHLTPIEWQILHTLVSAGGRTLTHQQIFDAVWSRQFGSPQQYLRVHITNLRRKIESDPASPRDRDHGARRRLPRRRRALT